MMRTDPETGSVSEGVVREGQAGVAVCSGSDKIRVQPRPGDQSTGSKGVALPLPRGCCAGWTYPEVAAGSC